MEKEQKGPIELITIDPGVHKSSIALWNFDKWLLYAEDLKNPEVFAIIAGIDVARVVIETPVLYAKKRKQHADVMRLLDVVNAMKTTAKNSAGVFPSAWKGQVPKKIHGERILNELRDFERAAIIDDKNHNTIDAIGIGLWLLGRLGRGGRWAG